MPTINQLVRKARRRMGSVLGGSLMALTLGCTGSDGVVGVAAPDGLGPRFVADPPPESLADEIFRQGVGLASMNDLHCAAYGEAMLWGLLDELIEVESYMFPLPQGGFGTGRSSPSTWRIDVASHLDRPGQPLPNPRSDGDMARTVFHEVIHLVRQTPHEIFVLDEMQRCDNGKGGHGGWEV